ncbi:MAG: radical SAM protein [Chitinispirillales bacterium]|nr:radical SAM protein [Chitinispirillales bacterium]
MPYKHSIVFGPILSRRLGFSLGVDIIPMKTCSLDCAYCECGKTTSHTNKREEYVSIKQVIYELDEFLNEDPPHIDVITLSGSGEPTLNSGVEKIISHIKTKYPQYKVALLTNAVLLTEKSVRKEILNADFVLPSVDAIFESSFQKINRPVSGVSVNFVLDGLREFVKIYNGILWVEYFVVPKINDSEAELTGFKKYFEEIKPARIQLNSLDRPPAFNWVKSASIERLLEIQNYFSPLPVEIISRNFKISTEKKVATSIKENILKTVSRRPITIEDIAAVFGHSINEIQEICRQLEECNEIEKYILNGQIYFKVKL